MHDPVVHDVDARRVPPGPNPIHLDGLTILAFAGEADAVRLVTFMPNFPKDLPFIAAPDGRWLLALALPAEARIEYLIEVERHGSLQRMRDPANPDTAANPFGENSVAFGPSYRPPAWSAVEPRARGRVTEFRVVSRALDRRRHHHHLYSPPGALARTPLPLVVVHDGSDYRRFAGLCTAVDALVSAGSIRPVRLALLDPRHRHEEYVGSDAHADHVAAEVVPHLARRVAMAEPLGIMGASLGAVAAWHAAHRHPGLFTRLFLQSGTFAFEPHPALEEPMFRSINRFLSGAEADPGLPGSIVYQSCGRYESLGAWNRRVVAALTAAGAVVTYREAWAGHDWGAWRDHLTDGLRLLYPPLRRPG
jgi:enterochelin esterase family protein